MRAAVQAGRIVARLPPQPRALVVAHGPEGAILAYATASDLVLLSADLRVDALIPLPAPALALALHPTHGAAVLTATRRVLLFRAMAGEWRAAGALEQAPADAESVAWRAGGELLVGARLFRPQAAAAWSEAWTLPVPGAALGQCAAFAADGAALLTCARGSRCAKLWTALDAPAAAFVYVPHPAPLAAAAWSPAPGPRRLLLTAAADGSARLWAQGEGAPLLLTRVFAHSRLAWLTPPPPPAPASPPPAPAPASAPSDAWAARVAASERVAEARDEWLVELSATHAAVHRLAPAPLPVRPRLALVARAAFACALPASVHATLAAAPGPALDARLFLLDAAALAALRVRAADGALHVERLARHVGHAAPVTALAPHPHRPLLASLDAAGAALVWRTRFPRLPSAHAPLAPLAALPEPAARLAWLPHAAPLPARLAVASPSLLLLYALHTHRSADHPADHPTDHPTARPDTDADADMGTDRESDDEADDETRPAVVEEARIALPSPALHLCALTSHVCVACQAAPAALLLYAVPLAPATLPTALPLPAPLTCLAAPAASAAPVALLTGHADGSVAVWHAAPAALPALAHVLRAGAAPVAALAALPHRVAALSAAGALAVWESEGAPDAAWAPESVQLAPAPAGSALLLAHSHHAAAAPALVLAAPSALALAALSAPPAAPFAHAWTHVAQLAPLPAPAACAASVQGWCVAACGAELLVAAPWADDAAAAVAAPRPAPWCHPTLVAELLAAADLPAALLLLRHLHAALAPAPASVPALPALSLAALLEGRAPPAAAAAAPRSLLDDDAGGRGGGGGDSDEAVLAALEAALTRVRLEELTRGEQRALYDCVRAAQQLVALQRAADASALRLLARRLVAPAAPFGPEESYTALASDAHALLVERLLPAPPAPLEWAALRAQGVGLWCTDVPLVRALFERLAKAAFGARRQPSDAALFYLALGKRSALAALYRAAKDERLAAFFAQDGASERARTAAHKNAYALLSQQRTELAAAFFLAAAAPRDALAALLRPTGAPPDVQLALLVARLADADAAPPGAAPTAQGPLALHVLREHVLPAAPDAWTAALAHRLLGDRPAALAALLAARAAPAPALLFAARQFRALLAPDDDARLARRAALAYVHARAPLLALLLTRSAPPALRDHAARLALAALVVRAPPPEQPARLAELARLNEAHAALLPAAAHLAHLGAVAAAVASPAAAPAQRRRWVLRLLRRLAAVPAAAALLARLGPDVATALLAPAELHALAAAPLAALPPALAALAVRASRLARALAAHRWARALAQLADRAADDAADEVADEAEDPPPADAWAAPLLAAAAARALGLRVAALAAASDPAERAVVAAAAAALASLARAADATSAARPELPAALTRIGPAAQLLWAAATADATATADAAASAPSSPTAGAPVPEPVPGAPARAPFVAPSSPFAPRALPKRRGLWSAPHELHREPQRLLQAFAAALPLLACASEAALTELAADGSRALGRAVVAQAMEAHPTEPLYATGGADGALLVWRWLSPAPALAVRPPATPPAPGGGVQSLRWLADGSRLVCADRAGSVSVWRADGSGKAALATLAAHTEHAHDVAALSASLLVSCGTGKRPLALWDLLAPPHRALVAALPTPPECGLACLAVDAGRAQVCAGGKDGALLLFDLRTQRLLHATPAAHARSVRSMDLAPDLATLATGGSDGALKLWERSASGEALRCVETWEAHKEQTFVRPSYGGVFHHPVATYGVTHVRFAAPHLLLSSGADGRLVQRTFMYKNAA